MDDVNATEGGSTENLWLISTGKVAVLTIFKPFAESIADEKRPIISKVDCNLDRKSVV